MKIKINGSTEDYTITQEEFDSIEWMFKEFNIKPTKEQVLSIIDESTYYEIKKHGIDDTVVRDNLYVDAIELMHGSYSNYRNGNDYQNYKIDIYQEALKKGFHPLNKEKEEFKLSSKTEPESVFSGTPHEQREDAEIFYVGSGIDDNSVVEDENIPKFLKPRKEFLEKQRKEGKNHFIDNMGNQAPFDLMGQNLPNWNYSISGKTGSGHLLNEENKVLNLNLTTQPWYKKLYYWIKSKLRK